MSETILFQTDRESFHVPILPRIDSDSNKPMNFGSFLPNRYRGGWPTYEQLAGLKKDLGVLSVLTLYSSKDPQESASLELLRVNTASERIRHNTVNIDTVYSYFAAARLLLSTHKPSYLHCATGANRTSIVALIASLFQEKAYGKSTDRATLVKLLSEATSYGFDFDKPERKIDMEKVLALSTAINLVSA